MKQVAVIFFLYVRLRTLGCIWVLINVTVKAQHLLENLFLIMCNIYCNLAWNIAAQGLNTDLQHKRWLQIQVKLQYIANIQASKYQLTD